MNFKADIAKIRLRFNAFNLRALRDAAFPKLIYWISHVRDMYKPGTQDFNIYVSAAWADHRYWCHKMVDLYTVAQEDPYINMRVTNRGKPLINPKTLNKNLPTDTNQLPPVPLFNSVDEQLTVLSDAVCREAHMQELIAVSLSAQDLHVVVQPVGPWTVPVQNPKDPNRNID